MEKEKKKRNTTFCCVPQCSQYAEVGTSFHLFPKDVELKKKWETALRMGKPASASMKVCSRHFHDGSYFPGNKIRRKLFPHAVPSCNLPQRVSDKVLSSSRQNQNEARMQRATNRRTRTNEPVEAASCAVVEPVAQEELEDVRRELPPPQSATAVQVNLSDERQNRPQDSPGIADLLCQLTLTEKCTQVNFLPECPGEKRKSNTVTLSDLLSSKESLFTFTGVHSFELLDAIVECVEDIAPDSSTNKKILSLRNRVILSMVKIKENMSFAALGVLFGVNPQTCSNYFKNMCPLLAHVIQVVIPWPDQELIRSNLPLSFKHYKNTRIILDCAETSIEKSKCLKCRILTYSQYKKGHTVKFNVGITPSGLITEISRPYGGRASDKHIVNESRVLDKMDFQDGVMVDKGFMIELECNERLLQLIRPPFLKQKEQLSREDALRNAEIARARVHVERVIQRLRQYELVRGMIPWTLAPYVHDVLTIVAGLTNLGPPVIHIDKFM